MTALGGAVIFFFFGDNFESLIPIMAAVAVGNFVYLSVADLIPELHHETNRNKIVMHTIWLLVGVLIIYSINLVLPHAE